MERTTIVGKKKVTPSLANLANGKSNSDSKPVVSDRVGVVSSVEDSPYTIDKLKEVWNEFAEQRKSQVGEYHLLKQEFTMRGHQVVVSLSNHLEEPFFQSIKTPLTEFLRTKLLNSNITIVGEIQEVGTKKIVYTNKEKFDHLVEKNPVLKELKDRLGLDTDY